MRSLKDELSYGFAVKLPNPAKPLVVETDGSIHGVGAVLLQSEVKEEYATLFFTQAHNAAESQLFHQRTRTVGSRKSLRRLQSLSAGQGILNSPFYLKG